IQPLVENSIQHGLKDIASDGRIRIEIASQEEHVVISVEDNGKGFDEAKLNMSAIEEYAKAEKASIKKGGMGLYNVNQRLVSLLGEDSRLHIENLHDGGSKEIGRASCR